MGRKSREKKERLEAKLESSTDFMEFVKGELDILIGDTDDKTMLQIKKEIPQLAQVFEYFCGGSKYKAKAFIRLFAKLAEWLPLTPLTGEDDEWELVDGYSGEPNTIKYINKRCPRVVKYGDGRTMDSEGVIFSYDGKTWFRDENSFVDISFPYEVPPIGYRQLIDKPVPKS